MLLLMPPQHSKVPVVPVVDDAVAAVAAVAVAAVAVAAVADRMLMPPQHRQNKNQNGLQQEDQQRPR